MKRHMKLIFKILEYVETHKTNGNNVPVPEFDDYERSEVEYHVKLCEEAGYVDTVVINKDGPPQQIRRLTWSGHDELDRMRKDGCCK